MINGEIVLLLNEFSALHSLEGDIFRGRAFDRASEAIQQETHDLSEIYNENGIDGLMNIDGVGKGIAGIIEEYLKKGNVPELKALRRKWPMDILALSKIEGLGPATIKRLYKEAKIKTIDDLREAIANGKINKVSRLGEAMITKISRSLVYFEKLGERRRLDEAMEIAEQIQEFLLGVTGVKSVDMAGSLRRMQETIGDLDLIINPRDGLNQKSKELILKSFSTAPFVDRLISEGETGASVHLKNGMRCDARLIDSISHGSALIYFTGDKNHNVLLRKRAIDRGLKLNEYGLYRGKKSIAGATEAEVYKALGLSNIPPELRLGTDEIELASKGALPHLISYDDLKGDLQIQTDWSDGEASIEEMASVARKAGLSYIVITDHTKTLTIANGLDEKRLRKQMAFIDSLNRKGGAFKILKGAEVNILKNGELDIEDEVLAELDVVGASVHSHFDMSKEDMTARIIKAIENPNVDIIFHPTGRRIGKREPYEFDIVEIAKSAKKHNVALEVNAHPERLDLKGEHIREVLKYGARLSIDSDAHDISGFDVLKYGIGTARRGGATKNDVINTRSYKDLLKIIKKK